MCSFAIYYLHNVSSVMQRLLSALVDTVSCIIVVVLPLRIRVKQYLFSLKWTILAAVSGGTASVLLGIESASVCFLELSFWGIFNAGWHRRDRYREREWEWRVINLQNQTHNEKVAGYVYANRLLWWKPVKGLPSLLVQKSSVFMVFRIEYKPALTLFPNCQLYYMTGSQSLSWYPS